MPEIFTTHMSSSSIALLIPADFRHTVLANPHKPADSSCDRSHDPALIGGFSSHRPNLVFHLSDMGIVAAIPHVKIIPLDAHLASNTPNDILAPPSVPPAACRHLPIRSRT